MNVAATVTRKLNMVTTTALTDRTGQREDVPSVYCDKSKSGFWNSNEPETAVCYRSVNVGQPCSPISANVPLRLISWSQMKFHTLNVLCHSSVD